ncbi:MAG: hypothetical protein KatS3mg087_1202 [Patescibacteria group bacterium]|nr:MAG: hypothetical protein KatS3mg087_1202 [Patescibacteria group bacterium]
MKAMMPVIRMLEFASALILNSQNLDAEVFKYLFPVVLAVGLVVGAVETSMFVKS